MRKKVVDSVLPWGMPCVMVCVFDAAFWVCVDCCRLRSMRGEGDSVVSEVEFVFQFVE
jgi:predicted Fe-S protein YdhL (DUF1289 family)